MFSSLKNITQATDNVNVIQSTNLTCVPVKIFLKETRMPIN